MLPLNELALAAGETAYEKKPSNVMLKIGINELETVPLNLSVSVPSPSEICLLKVMTIGENYVCLSKEETIRISP